MSVLDCVIIGGGVIGATISKSFTKQGIDHVILDCRKEMAGTTPSGGHLKMSWLGMKEQEYTPLLHHLDNIWGLCEDEFVVYPSKKKEKVYRLDTDLVTNYYQCANEEVINIEQVNNYPTVITAQTRYRCRMLIVAAGVWSKDLLSKHTNKLRDLKAKQGVSFRFSGKIDPFIKPWAPYKQITCHQQSLNEVWIGDGTAILAKNWTQEIVDRCRSRCTQELPNLEYSKELQGYRPVLTPVNINEPCFMDRITQRVWIVTGASKKGTIAAAWAADKLVNLIRRKSIG